MQEHSTLHGDRPEKSASEATTRSSRIQVIAASRIMILYGTVDMQLMKPPHTFTVSQGDGGLCFLSMLLLVSLYSQAFRCERSRRLSASGACATTGYNAKLVRMTYGEEQSTRALHDGDAQLRPASVNMKN